MIHTLHAKNFTIFSDATFEFAPGLNVIIGDNGTGKSHLLQLGYTCEYVLFKTLKDYLSAPFVHSKESWALDYAQKLKNVFKTEQLSHLCRSPATEAVIKMVPSWFGQPIPELTMVLSIHKEQVNMKQIPLLESFFKQQSVMARKLSASFQNDGKVVQNQKAQAGEVLVSNSANLISLPLFFPSKEVLSIYPDFLTRYQERQNAFDETYYDLCNALTRSIAKRREEITDWVAPLEQLIPGKLIFKSNHFYLQISEQENREISLISEGFRKIAMLNYLVLNGSLTTGTTLFWDEPAANLNAKWQVKLVDTLVQLANAGVQIILTVHDLFLMKELALRVDAGETTAHFFELLVENEELQLVQGDNLNDLFTVVALDTALEQYDREQDILLQD